MSVTVMYFTPEPLAVVDESFGMDVLHHIPYCKGKTFTGAGRYTHVLGFPTACMVVFINDDQQHSDDLHVLFALPGGSFYFQKEDYNHEIDQCVELLELTLEVKFSDVKYCSNGDVAMVFKGGSPTIRKRVLDDHRKYMMKAAS